MDRKAGLCREAVEEVGPWQSPPTLKSILANPVNSHNPTVSSSVTEVAGRDPGNPGPVTQFRQAGASSSRSEELPGDLGEELRTGHRGPLPASVRPPGAPSCLQFRGSKQRMPCLPRKPSAMSGPGRRCSQPPTVHRTLPRQSMTRPQKSALQCPGRGTLLHRQALPDAFYSIILGSRVDVQRCVNFRCRA